MRSRLNILVFALCSLSAAVLVPSCRTVSTAPLDDAYYWPDKNTPTTPINSDTIGLTPSSSDKIEYLNVQDTTVTIRIKK